MCLDAAGGGGGRLGVPGEVGVLLGPARLLLPPLLLHGQLPDPQVLPDIQVITELSKQIVCFTGQKISAMHFLPPYDH